ncbi:MAG: VIT domain-containing protein [Bacteroidota bacterium]
MNTNTQLLLFPFLFLLLLALVSCKSQQVSLIAETKPVDVLDPLPSLRDSVVSLTIVEVENEKNTPIRLDSLIATTKLGGAFARTTLEFTFYNPNNRQLEGSFVFPLQAGQSISRFALEVNNKMREGVIVPKEKARVAYETTVRENIDPGLLEPVGGNTFKARIFPIPAKGHKKVIIAFDEALRSNGQQLTYHFASPWKEKVFYYRQHIRENAASPSLDIIHPKNFTWEKLDRVWSTTIIDRVSKVPSFDAYLASSANIQQIEEGQGGETWIYAQVGLSKETKMRSLPEKVILYWDCSHSAHTRNLERELELVRSLLLQGKDRIKKLELVAFGATIRQSMEISPNSEETIDQFIQTLRELPLDGGTQFQQLNFERKGAQEYWLFSDGISSLREASKPSPNAPVYAFTSSAQYENAWLNRLCRVGKGKRIDLTQQSNEQALGAVFQAHLLVESISWSGKDFSEVYPLPGTILTDRLVLKGKLHDDEGQLNVVISQGNGTPQKLSFTFDKLNMSAGSGALQRSWAEEKLQHLQEHPKENEESILDLAQTYKLVSSTTSLLVLDRLEDYLKYEIVPPKELQKAYYAQLDNELKGKQEAKQKHLDQVAADFLKRKVWWETRFAIPKDPYNLGQREKGELGDTAMPAEVAAVESESAAEEDREDISEALAGQVAGVNSSANSQHIYLMDSVGEFKSAINNKGKIKLALPQRTAEYVKKIDQTLPEEQLDVYFSLKKEYGKLPAFYLDVADYFWDKGQKEIAFQILSNLAELEIANHEMQRIAAHRFNQWSYLVEATFLFQKVLAERPEEPQSYRDLALTYEKSGDIQQAVDYIYQVVERPWDTRFPLINVLAAHEMNAIINSHPQKKVDISLLEKRLLADMPCDLRVVIDWDANGVDLDLWVTDPRGEKCLYSHKKTEIGGRMSSDFTGGYGPEEFLLRRAMKGEYKVEANYYGSNTASLTGPATLFAKLILNYGTPEEEIQEITLRLEDVKKVVQIGTFEFE